MLLTFDLVVSRRIFLLVSWMTSSRGQHNSATESMRPKNFLQTTEFGLAGRRVLVSFRLLML